MFIILTFHHLMASQFQEERQKRMLATDDTSDEDSEADKTPSSQRPKSISGDDLGDSFSLDEEPNAKRGWVDEVLQRKDTTESEDDDSSEDSDDAESDGVYDGPDDDSDATEKPTLKDWEQSDDDDVERDLEEEEPELDEEEDDSIDDEEEMETRGKKKSREKAHVEIRKSDKESLDIKKMKSNHSKVAVQSDIPFIIEAPKNLEEFCALLENFSNADKILVINRIRASNAIKLAAENRKKMQVCNFLQLSACSLSLCVRMNASYLFCAHVSAYL